MRQMRNEFIGVLVFAAFIGCSAPQTDQSNSTPFEEAVPRDSVPGRATNAQPGEKLNLNKATPEERLELSPWLKPEPNFRETLSPLVRNEEVKYSQYYEELVIRDFFQDQRNGTYLDVGCYHPIFISTTYYLEHELGWTGIGIDANERHAPQWKRARPNSKFFAYAVSDRDADTVTLYLAGGLSSLDEENAVSAGAESRPVDVPTITLNTLLDREGVTSIDFLSMDIEGAEPDALKGFDIGRFKPRLVCIEHEPTEKNLFLLEYFENHDYERIDKYLSVDRVNWYFAPKNPS